MWNSSTSMPFAVSRASIAIPSCSSNRSTSSWPVSSASSSCSSRNCSDDVCVAVDVEQPRLDVVAAAGLVALAQRRAPSRCGARPSPRPSRRAPSSPRRPRPRSGRLPAPRACSWVQQSWSPCWAGSRGEEDGNVSRKLVVFVPPDALEPVRDAIFAAGAGRIGDYERCCWYTEGTGTFLPREGADPTIGEVGKEQRVRELRLETVYPDDAHDASWPRSAPRIRTRSRPSTSCGWSSREGAPLHRRRRARQPGPGRLRLRDRGRGRRRAGGPRRGDRRRDQQRGRVQRPRSRASRRRPSSASPSSRSSPTRS